MSEDLGGNEENKPVPMQATDPASWLSMLASPFLLYSQWYDYWTDAVQRKILFFDVLRRRSNWHIQHEHDDNPTVLNFEYELVLDGRKFAHPVNYYLLRIIPPEGVVADPKKRPFIVFDPRGGHGPGIGGMKKDSEVGDALREGHPCYFVGFRPMPVPGQTVEHVTEAESIFVSQVMELHPDAPKPCLIGNCQAGWQIAMLGAVYPELIGVLILAGAPLSYWAGTHGKNPMRYSGGLVGGSWATAFLSDLGNGCFDGAALVANFEKLDPANTYWKKAHNLYAKVDTEAERFLGFEKWWGSPIFLDRKEIQFIVDSLFVGNRFSKADVRTSEGLRVDLRNIKSPIIVFCSQGDNITPPPQALDWILDLYRSNEEIVAAGQTIIYSMHQKIGHLGIFVSGSVATKEHAKFIANIDLIESLPPGLYEAVFIDKTTGTDHPDLASGNYVLRFEKRTLDDIRAIGCNTEKDERCFLVAKRVSENLRGIYESYMSPFVRLTTTKQSADLLRALHPIRVRFNMFSDQNPFLKEIGRLADYVKADRHPVSPTNMFWQWQELASNNIGTMLNAYRDMRDYMEEKTFFGIYGSKWLQSALGLRIIDRAPRCTAIRDLDRERGIEKRIQKILDRAAVGGLPEALVRGMLYVVLGGGKGGIDEREFNMLKQLCQSSAALPKLSMKELKGLIRKQYEILVLDEKNAIEAISKLLDNTTEAAAQESLSAINASVQAHGRFTDEEKRRLQNLEQYFKASHTTPRRRATDIEVFRDVK